MRDEDDTAPKESDPRDIGLGAVPGVIGSQVTNEFFQQTVLNFSSALALCWALLRDRKIMNQTLCLKIF